MKMVDRIKSWVYQAWALAAAVAGFLVVVFLVHRARRHIDAARRHTDEITRMRVNDEKTRAAAGRVAVERRKAIEHSEKALEIKHRARRRAEQMEDAGPLSVDQLVDRINRL